MSVTVDCLDGCGAWAMPGRSRCRSCESARQRVRNAKPSRHALYGGGWAKESLAIRAASEGCVVCGTFANLSVDHPTRDVLCLTHHGEREAARRAAKRC